MQFFPHFLRVNIPFFPAAMTVLLSETQNFTPLEGEDPVSGSFLLGTDGDQKYLDATESSKSLSGSGCLHTGESSHWSTG
jgi:hypothetical protein